MKRLRKYAWIPMLIVCGCFDNNPYPGADPSEKTLYYSYAPQVKHLDPVKAYNAGYYRIMRPIYEPPFEYHYLKRPALLIGRTAVEVPVPVRYGKDGGVISADAPPEDVDHVIYTIHLKKGIRYQDHAALATDAQGRYLFHLDRDGHFPRVVHPDELLSDPRVNAKTRPLYAQDYVHQWKRLANPTLECPILQVFENVVVGMPELRAKIEAETARIRAARRLETGAGYNQERDERRNPIYVDLRKFEFEGVKALDAETFQITLNRDFPQITQWMAMSFFAPIPWEASRFYKQAAAVEWNLTFDRFPIGTGAYKLVENRPNYRIVLERNDNYREDLYPSEGELGDKEAGLLEYAGRRAPFIDRTVYMLDMESPPRWKKFLQGYYDFLELMPVDTDMSQQVMEVTMEGSTGISPEMADMGIGVHEGARPLARYYAFNMRDSIWGGYTEEKRKMRQAVSIAIDMESYVQIFQNGRGLLSQGPLPIGMFGHRTGEAGINPTVYEWDASQQKPRKKSIEEAKRLLAEAGYAGGRDADGNQLVLNYDIVAVRGVKTISDWMNKQLSQIGVKVEVRVTDSNRWQDKLITGNFQFMGYGWGADYPDPENFLFLFYGPNGKVENHGENYANYANPMYDRLFEQMETMPNSDERQAIIDEMVGILRLDAPWVFSWQPINYTIQHEWVKNYKFRFEGGHNLRYLDLDAELRAQSQDAWNRPLVWPLWIMLALVVGGVVPVTLRAHRRRTKGVSL